MGPGIAARASDGRQLGTGALADRAARGDRACIAVDLAVISEGHLDRLDRAQVVLRESVDDPWRRALADERLTRARNLVEGGRLVGVAFPSCSPRARCRIPSKGPSSCPSARWRAAWSSSPATTSGSSDGRWISCIPRNPLSTLRPAAASCMPSAWQRRNRAPAGGSRADLPPTAARTHPPAIGRLVKDVPPPTDCDAAVLLSSLMRQRIWSRTTPPGPASLATASSSPHATGTSRPLLSDWSAERTPVAKFGSLPGSGTDRMAA